MLPQLDTSHYFSQFFWLVVCLVILILVFKKVFIPRVNTIMNRRQSILEQNTKITNDLTREIESLEEEIEKIRKREKQQVTDIIKEAIRKSEKTLNEQLLLLKAEQEELTSSIRQRFNDETASLGTAFKLQVNTVAQMIFERIFSHKDSK